MSDCEYTNRKKMEETTSKVFARLHHVKSILCRTIKKTPHLCGGSSNCNNSYCSPTSYYAMTTEIDQQLSESTLKSWTDTLSDDTISTISRHSSDSGVSTLSDFSHCSLLSVSESILHRTTTILHACQVRCDPSIINYVSHHLLANHQSELFLDEDDIEETSAMQMPLAESSRRVVHDSSDQTIMADDHDGDDERSGPLTSTLVDQWHKTSQAYTATFRDDLTVRKNEFVQVLRCPHPHWAWIRNEESSEGFVPIDCLVAG